MPFVSEGAAVTLRTCNDFASVIGGLIPEMRFPGGARAQNDFRTIAVKSAGCVKAIGARAAFMLLIAAIVAQVGSSRPYWFNFNAV